MSTLPFLIRAQPMIYALSWNPSDKNASVTLSDNNRTYATAGSFIGVRSLNALPSWKVYFECDVVQKDAIFGVGNASANLGSYAGANTNSWGWQIANGSKVYYNGSSASYTGAGDAAASDIIMVAIDMAAQKFWGGRNGTWHNSGNPSAGTGNAPFGSAIASSGLFVFGSANVTGKALTFRPTNSYPVPLGFTPASIVS
jgi:hypothetical protein